MTAPSATPPGPAPKPQHAAPIPAPTGTRDLYPIELARRRFIEDKWRKVAIRHGFDEIDGPTFEHASLYAVKSGDGILGELFQTFSGKDEERVKKMGAALATGERGGDAMAPYALRPEFTPTLARMYAARAKQLPQPTKWFWQGPCFRAERPQRGRLREFWQWNVDHIGSGNRVDADTDVLLVCADLLRECGLKSSDLQIKLSNRAAVAELMIYAGVSPTSVPDAMSLLDRRGKMNPAEFQHAADALNLNVGLLEFEFANWNEDFTRGVDSVHVGVTRAKGPTQHLHVDLTSVTKVVEQVQAAGFAGWCKLDLSIARGLAYYTGMVFEVIVDGERAIAGGGRYDNLIELFSGPPTPAVGFGMGDVVLSLVLQDKKGPDGKPLMPSDREIAAALGLRPDAFVISNGTPESDAQVAPLLASLRRAGMHARRTYKTTRNIGKLLKEASDAGAVRAIIIENSAEATLKNLDTNTQHPQRVPLADIAKTLPLV